MCSYVCACLAVDINLDLRLAQIIEFSVTMPYQCSSVVMLLLCRGHVEDVYDLYTCAGLIEGKNSAIIIMIHHTMNKKVYLSVTSIHHHACL